MATKNGSKEYLAHMIGHIDKSFISCRNMIDKGLIYVV